MRERPTTFLLLGLPLILPAEIALSAVDPEYGWRQDEGLWFALSALLLFVVLPFATAMILLAVGPEPGSGVGIRKAVGRTARLLPALVVVGTAQAIGVFVGLLLLILPGLALAARWLLATPAIVFEQRSGIDALRRSNGLVRGQTWAVIAGVALLTAFSLVVWGASFVVVLVWGHHPVVFTGLTVVFDALTLGVWAAMSLAAYRRVVTQPDSG